MQLIIPGKVSTLLALSLMAGLSLAQTVVDLPQLSQRASLMQRVGLTDIEVDYSRPAVNDRKIWGEVVAYGFTHPTVDGLDQAPWKAGANLNTVISFTHQVSMGGKQVPAGRYGLFIAIENDSIATVVLSKTHQAYGQYFYKAAEDVLRQSVKTRACAPTELLTFAFDEVGPRHAVLSMRWDQKSIPVRIDVDVPEIVTSSLIEQLKQPATFTWQGRVQAVRYLIEQQVHLDLALQWANEALNGSPGGELLTGERNFSTLTAKYHVLHALKREEEAQVYLMEALESPGNLAPARAVAFANNLLSKNRKVDAHRVLVWALNKWPQSWETQHGMARWLSAEGNYKDALKLERKALATAPNDQREAIASSIQRLEQSTDLKP